MRSFISCAALLVKVHARSRSGSFALRQSQSDPGRDGARLARACAREESGGPVLTAHRFELIRIEVEKAEAFHGSSPRTNLPITSGYKEVLGLWMRAGLRACRRGGSALRPRNHLAAVHSFVHKCTVQINPSPDSSACRQAMSPGNFGNNDGWMLMIRRGKALSIGLLSMRMYPARTTSYTPAPCNCFTNSSSLSLERRVLKSVSVIE